MTIPSMPATPVYGQDPVRKRWKARAVKARNYMKKVTNPQELRGDAKCRYRLELAYSGFLEPTETESASRRDGIIFLNIPAGRDMQDSISVAFVYQGADVAKFKVSRMPEECQVSFENTQPPDPRSKALTINDARAGCSYTVDLSDPLAIKPAHKGVGESALVKIRKNEIQLLKKIRFEPKKTDILPESHPVLDQLADLLKNNPFIKKIEIQAHIDRRGPAAFNMKLSEQRAEAVRRHLIEKGVSPKRMIAKGYGENVPICCEPHPCPAKCRRIEVWIIE